MFNKCSFDSMVLVNIRQNCVQPEILLLYLIMYHDYMNVT